MAAKVTRLAPQARADLEAIWLYTREKWSVAQADRYYADLATAFAGLADGTRIGTPVSVRHGYLRCLVGSHVIFYRATDVQIDIIRILHQAMDVDNNL